MIYFRFIIIIFFFSLLSSCLNSDSSDESSSSTSVSTPPSSGTTPTVDPLSCSERILDSGQKGIVTAVNRGNYSSTKIDPNSGWSATAYVDVGGLSMKLIYNNGSVNVIETIAGEIATASYVRLVFLSTGVPFVFWASGTALVAASRSAPLGETGTWTADLIDTVTAVRGIDANVNPNDEILVSYLTSAVATGRAKFVYCSDCTGPSSFQLMTPNAYLENANIIANAMQTGAAWCNAGSDVYYPAISFPGAAATRYGICRNATLSACKDSANWNFVNIVGTTSIASSLIIDPLTVGAVPVAAVRMATGVITYKMGATACTAAPIAFSAGTTLGTANTGNAWFRFLMDALGKFHLIANETTTSVRYFNSQTTNSSGVWNAAGVVETTTLHAVTATQGSADINENDQTIKVSFGVSVAPFNLRSANILNYTQASNSLGVNLQFSDSTGALQLPTANSQLSNVASASDSLKRPAVAYVDFSAGAVTTARLKYAYQNGSDPDQDWFLSSIPGTNTPQFPSLVFDESDLPWISFYDGTLRKYYLATNSQTNGMGAWTIYENSYVPNGAPPALPSANETALASFYSSGVAYPLLIFADTNTVSKGIKSCLFNPTTQSFCASLTTIDGLTSGALGASHLRAAYTSEGKVALVYRDLSANILKYTATTDGSTWSSPISISSLGQGVGANIALNSSNQPSVTFMDKTNNRVSLATCTSTFSDCSVGTGWSSQVIETAAGISGLATGNEQLLSTAISINSSGYSFIQYPRGSGNDGNLILYENTTGSFLKEIFALGTNGNRVGITAANFGISGWNISSTINTQDSISSFYIGPGNFLYLNSCGY